MAHVIKRGLNIPIAGQPVQTIASGPEIGSVGLLGDDYVGMRPTMFVKDGDQVSLGQPLFEDKKTPGVIFTAPGAGRVHSVNRGEKRKFESLIIQLEGDRQESFPSYDSFDNVNDEQLRELLVKSGEWTALRTRPFSKIPAPDATARSIFVTAMDTNPLAAEPELIISRSKELFERGLQLLTKINRGPVFVCTREDSRVPGREIPGVQFETFDGPHPAGLPGTHIHLLDPVNAKHTVWHINYQDVIAWGHLISTGHIYTPRVVSVAGPPVKKPQLYSARRGANLHHLLAGNLASDHCRIVSGSILCGSGASEPKHFLGRYHLQVSVLEEGDSREFLGWQKPGLNKFSVTRTYLGSWFSGRKFNLNTNINGSHRMMVPIGTYERVVPLDVMPTHLLRALIVGDTENAQLLGALELDEEDLALCTFVCPGKYDYGSILRENLTRIEKEG